jgi:hypothetical protein
LRKPSIEKYKEYNHVFESPEIKNEEKDLFENDRSRRNQSRRRFISPDYNFILQFNLIHLSRNKNKKNNRNNQNNQNNRSNEYDIFINQDLRRSISPDYDFN